MIDGRLFFSRLFVISIRFDFYLDDMNYDQKFRRLTFEILFVFLLIDFARCKNDPLKKSSDVLGDEKRVFDINFGHNKNYAIDDCIPLAFGDFNADKIVDIFCRNTIGDSIRVMINDDRSPTSKEQYKLNLT